MEILNYSADTADIFFKEYFEKKPVIIRGFPLLPDLTQRDFLSLLRTGFCQHGSRQGRARIYQSGQPITKDFSAWLPKESDHSLDQYLDRLKEDGLDDLCFLLYSAHQQSDNLFGVTKDIVELFRNRFGLPSVGVDSAIFAGNYSKTPEGGIHTDTASIFSIVLSGTKRMALWPYEYFQDCTFNTRGGSDVLHHIDYRDHLDQSLILEGLPGDVLAWPSSYWHIGVGNSSAVSTYNLSLFQQDTSLDFIKRALADSLESNRRIESYRTHEIQTDRLPEALEKAVQSLENTIDEISFRGLIKSHWAKFLSRDALIALPKQASSAKFDPNVWYRLDRQFPIVTFTANEDFIGLAVRNQSLWLANHDVTREFLTLIHGARPWNFQEFWQTMSKFYELDQATLDVILNQIQLVLNLLGTLGVLLETKQNMRP